MINSPKCRFCSEFRKCGWCKRVRSGPSIGSSVWVVICFRLYLMSFPLVRLLVFSSGSAFVLLVLFLYLHDEYQCRVKQESDKLGSTFPPNHRSLLCSGPSNRHSMCAARSSVILSYGLYLLMYALSYLPINPNQIDLCYRLNLTSDLLYYITRLCNYWFFLRRLSIVLPNPNFAQKLFYVGFVLLSITAFISGVFQSFFEKPQIVDQECGTVVDSLPSIVSLIVFISLDTALALSLLKVFLKPMQETVKFQETMQVSTIRANALKTRNSIKRYKVSSFVTTFSTVSLNILYIFTNCYDIVPILYDIFSIIDALLHSIAILYTYRNWGALYDKLTCQFGNLAICSCIQTSSSKTESKFNSNKVWFEI